MQSMGLQRIGHDLATEEQQILKRKIVYKSLDFSILVLIINFAS